MSTTKQPVNMKLSNVILICLLCLLPATLLGQESEESAEPTQIPKTFLVRVPLPLNGNAATSVQQRLRQLLSEANVVRPTVVLEFDTSRGRTGKGSTLGSCIDLARFLMSAEMNRLRLIAFIPGRQQNRDDKPLVQLSGHAVLVALAADEIAIDPDAQFGAAGADESVVDSFLKETYRKVVSERLKVPVPVAMAMLDKDSKLYRVATSEGSKFVDAEGLREIEGKGELLSYETLSVDKNELTLSGAQLSEFGFVRYRAKSLAELARRLEIPLDSIQQDRASARSYVATRVELPGYVDSSTLQWITRSIEPKIAGGKTNMIIIEFDSANGDLDTCIQMARRIAQFDPNEVQTVGYINKQAKGPAGLLALCCNHLVMAADAELGGAYELEVDEAELEDLKLTAAGLAEQVGRDPASLQAMIAPNLDIVRFRDKTTGEEKLMTRSQREARDDAENWLPQGEVDMFDPLDANTAYNFGIARQVVSDFQELQSYYQLESEPELLKPTTIDRWLYEAGLFLASPFVAPWLLFAAMFLLFNEVSQPGLGVPGFLGTLCLILYFWSQHLDGNASWLEILLFVAGMVFVAIELFVLPGFGIFGIGGLVMIVVSIVLASQTFVFPTTTEQVRELPRSLFALCGALGGTAFAMVALRTILPNTPMFKRMMLEPPVREETGLDNEIDPEAMVNWGYLKGKTGEAVTNLVPAGKARIGGQLLDVISEGRLIEKGQRVLVIEVAGNRIVVVAENS